MKRVRRNFDVDFDTSDDGYVHKRARTAVAPGFSFPSIVPVVNSHLLSESDFVATDAPAFPSGGVPAHLRCEGISPPTVVSTGGFSREESLVWKALVQLRAADRAALFSLTLDEQKRLATWTCAAFLRILRICHNHTISQLMNGELYHGSLNEFRNDPFVYASIKNAMLAFRGLVVCCHIVYGSVNDATRWSWYARLVSSRVTSDDVSGVHLVSPATLLREYVYSAMISKLYHISDDAHWNQRITNDTVDCVPFALDEMYAALATLDVPGAVAMTADIANYDPIPLGSTKLDMLDKMFPAGEDYDVTQCVGKRARAGRVDAALSLGDTPPHTLASVRADAHAQIAEVECTVFSSPRPWKAIGHFYDGIRRVLRTSLTLMSSISEAWLFRATRDSIVHQWSRHYIPRGSAAHDVSMRVRVRVKDADRVPFIHSMITANVNRLVVTDARSGTIVNLATLLAHAYCDDSRVHTGASPCIVFDAVVNRAAGVCSGAGNMDAVPVWCALENGGVRAEQDGVYDATLYAWTTPSCSIRESYSLDRTLAIRECCIDNRQEAHAYMRALGARPIDSSRNVALDAISRSVHAISTWDVSSLPYCGNVTNVAGVRVIAQTKSGTALLAHQQREIRALVKAAHTSRAAFGYTYALSRTLRTRVFPWGNPAPLVYDLANTAPNDVPACADDFRFFARLLSATGMGKTRTFMVYIYTMIHARRHLCRHHVHPASVVSTLSKKDGSTIPYTWTPTELLNCLRRGDNAVDGVNDGDRGENDQSDVATWTRTPLPTHTVILDDAGNVTADITREEAEIAERDAKEIPTIDVSRLKPSTKMVPRYTHPPSTPEYYAQLRVHPSLALSPHWHDKTRHCLPNTRSVCIPALILAKELAMTQCVREFTDECPDDANVCVWTITSIKDAVAKLVPLIVATYMVEYHARRADVYKRRNLYTAFVEDELAKCDAAKVSLAALVVPDVLIMNRALLSVQSMRCIFQWLFFGDVVCDEIHELKIGSRAHTMLVSIRRAMAIGVTATPSAVGNNGFYFGPGSSSRVIQSRSRDVMVRVHSIHSDPAPVFARIAPMRVIVHACPHSSDMRVALHRLMETVYELLRDGDRTMLTGRYRHIVTHLMNAFNATPGVVAFIHEQINAVTLVRRHGNGVNDNVIVGGGYDDDDDDDDGAFAAGGGHGHGRRRRQLATPDTFTAPFARAPVRAHKMYTSNDAYASICSICYDVFKSPVQLRCTHLFCVACIKQWIIDMNQVTCPMQCHENVDVVYTPVLDSSVDESAATAAAESIVEPAAESIDEPVAVVVEPTWYRNKIPTLRKLLIELLTDGENSIVIFGSMPLALSAIESVVASLLDPRAFRSIGKKNQTRQGRQAALGEFQARARHADESKRIRVLIVNRRGNSAIDLSMANVNIAFDVSASTMSAVAGISQRRGRIFRLGQTRQTVTHSLVSVGSPEEYMLHASGIEGDSFGTYTTQTTNYAQLEGIYNMWRRSVSHVGFTGLEIKRRIEHLHSIGDPVVEFQRRDHSSGLRTFHAAMRDKTHNGNPCIDETQPDYGANQWSASVAPLAVTAEEYARVYEEYIGELNHVDDAISLAAAPALCVVYTRRGGVPGDLPSQCVRVLITSAGWITSMDDADSVASIVRGTTRNDLELGVYHGLILDSLSLR